MPKASEVINHLIQSVPEEMGCWRGEPYGPGNIDNDAEVTRALYCVTPSPEISQYCRDNGYDLLISHHPFRVPFPHIILHTALDCCTRGLNDLWREHLNIQNPKHFMGTLGWYGEIEPMTFEQLCASCESFMDRPIIGQKACNTEDGLIRSVVVCTGLGGAVHGQALETGADCYILGEATQDLSRGGFRAYIECGHTNSEWIGVRSMQEFLQGMGVQVDLCPPEMDRFSQEVFCGGPEHVEAETKRREEMQARWEEESSKWDEKWAKMRERMISWDAANATREDWAEAWELWQEYSMGYDNLCEVCMQEHTGPNDCRPFLEWFVSGEWLEALEDDPWDDGDGDRWGWGFGGGRGLW